MGNVYTIRSTDGETIIPIIPGQADGYNGYDKNTDLKLHGLGYLNWGAGVNENLFRITENFSTPEKELGDYNPLSGINNYTPTSTVTVPKDWHDLGHGLGINDPVVGQLWFNTTQKKMFVYVNTTGSQYRWLPITNTTNFDNTEPLNPNVGELWFDVDNSNPISCVTSSVLKIYNPSHPNAALDNGWVTIIEDAVKKCGDTMTGDLEISKESENTKLTLNSNVGFQRSFYFSTSELARWAITANSNLETGSNNGSDFIISRYDDNGDIIAGHPIQIKRSDGKVILNGDPIEPLHAVTKQYVDDVANPDTGVVAGTYNSVTVNSKGKITAGYSVDASSFIPGTKLLFPQASAPTGWVQDLTDDADNRMLRLVNTAGGGFGGSHSPIINNVVAPHTHGFNTAGVSVDHTHSGSTSNPGDFITGSATVNIEGSSGAFGSATGSFSLISAVGGWTAGKYNYNNTFYRGFQLNAGSHTHSFSTGGISANHSHAGSTDNGSSQTNWVPRYRDIIVCTKI